MKRWITTGLAVIATCFVMACSPPSQDDRDEEARETLGIAMDKGGWNEAEKTSTSDGKPYGIVSTDQVKCSPRFSLIPGTGDTLAKQRESASFTLVAVVSDMNGSNAVPLNELPNPFKNEAEGLSKERFNELIRAHRDSNDALKALCGDRKKK